MQTCFTSHVYIQSFFQKTYIKELYAYATMCAIQSVSSIHVSVNGSYASPNGVMVNGGDLNSVTYVYPAFSADVGMNQ